MTILLFALASLLIIYVCVLITDKFIQWKILVTERKLRMFREENEKKLREDFKVMFETFTVKDEKRRESMPEDVN